MPSNWKREERNGERSDLEQWVGRSGKFYFGYVECEMLMNQWASHGDSFIGESEHKEGLKLRLS